VLVPPTCILKPLSHIHPQNRTFFSPKRKLGLHFRSVQWVKNMKRDGFKPQDLINSFQHWSRVHTFLSLITRYSVAQILSLYPWHNSLTSQIPHFKILCSFWNYVKGWIVERLGSGGEGDRLLKSYRVTMHAWACPCVPLKDRCYFRLSHTQV
jgi:hypothetical protein